MQSLKHLTDFDCDRQVVDDTEENRLGKVSTITAYVHKLILLVSA
jgi:hypothetical protein